MAGFLRNRTVKYGGNAVTAVVIVLGILVITNYMASRYPKRIDLTEGAIYSLSGQTVTLLDALDRDVRIVAFYREQTQEGFKNLLDLYAYHSDRISYRFVDPDTNPVEAKRYNIQAYNTTVLEAGDKEERIRTSDEPVLTNAIARVVRDKEKKVYFLTGHGEKRATDPGREGFAAVREGLQLSNYVVRDTFLLARAGEVPDDCSLLLVAGPTKSLLEGEVDAIRTYLEAGGSGLFMLDPGVETGLESMLANWSVELRDDYVVDGGGFGRLFNLDYSMPMAAEYGRHPITEKHPGLMTAYLMARSVSRSGNTAGVDAVELVRTSPQSWGESDFSSIEGDPPEEITFDPASDLRGPISLAMAVTAEPSRPKSGEEERKTRLVVFGDSDFVNNQYFSFQANGDLFLNAVSWLLEEGEMIAIRPKDRGFRPISLTQGDEQVVFWFSIILLPAIPLVAGVMVWVRRR